MIEKTDQPYPENLPVLTSLRFWAAYGVACYHYSMVVLANLPEETLSNIPVLSKMHLGVDFFFVLSGFILTHVYKEKLGQKQMPIWHFYIKRIARVYPVFFVIFLISLVELYSFYAAGVNEAPDPLTPLNFILYTLCMHAWFDIDISRFNPPSWSISAEWFAYLLFPFFLWGMLRLKKVWIIAGFVGIIGVICISLSYSIFNLPLTKLDFNVGILRIIPEFVLGMGLYMFGQKYRIKRSNPAAFIVLAVGLLLATALLLHDYIIVLIFGAVILMGAEQGRAGVQWKLTGKNPVYLGEISYSVYLLHIPMLEIVLSTMKVLNASEDIILISIVCCFYAIIPAAMLSYKFIERPARQYITRKAIGKTGKRGEA